MESKHRKEVQRLQDRLDSAVGRYDEEVERLRQEQERLRRELKDRSLAVKSKTFSDIYIILIGIEYDTRKYCKS